MRTPAARRAKVDQAAESRSSGFEQLFEVRVLQHLIRAGQTSVPIAGGERDHQAAGSQTGRARPTDQAVVARVLLRLVAPGPHEHAAAVEVAARR